MNELTELIPEISALIAALGGGGIVSGIAQFFLKRTLTKIGTIPATLSEIKSELNLINHKIESINEIKDDVKFHDRRLVALEVKNGTPIDPPIANGRRDKRFSSISPE